jgi:hypothetical protein
MSIFKTDVSPGVVLSTDQVVSAGVDTTGQLYFPGLKKTQENMNVVNVRPGAVRRTSGES